ncbi:MAG: archaeosortase/exosortase family protein [Candidatus Magnetobacterium sp. LHC-1]|uniref:Archaeosortase/exosortase family protein n=1 Tax=Candidatus Magnetobacterium casense TaxID=1455061 RepID=A0ABS6RVF3_9BACT|nr:archaeosortase/exosortase family protein [Candidatus Magnetobacterium casensis]MBF0605944.1 archaeosortase/exosortase family protein [Nitrospirota bacterium]MBV6340330.1 archaeosortase/exosortase family protein [Candidatus Magnetobacterium casensis]
MKPDKRKQPRFIILEYLLLSALVCTLLLLRPVTEIIDINGLYTHLVVFLSAKTISGVFNIPCIHSDSFILLPSISLDVRFGCNGLEAVILYVIAIIVFPAPWRLKLQGAVVGFVLLQFFNIIRIAALAYTGVYHRDFFDLIHVYLAQVVMIAIVLGMLIVYLNYVRGQDIR